MTRLLFWLALAWLVTLALRTKFKAAVRPPAPGRPRAGALPEAEAMVCCAHCGIHYPASETVRLKGQDYCSLAHASLA